MAWLLKWWKRRQRNIDLLILWPQCRRQASNLDLAKAAFLRHALIDNAWSDLTPQEIAGIVDNLPE